MGLRVEAHDLAKKYGEVRAVDGITFTVEPGEFFGLLGPNGAGKTTTLEILEGLRRPDGGRALVDGMDPARRDPRILGRMGVQLQASAFFEKLSAREQLDTFGALYGAPATRTGELLELVGLTEQAAIQADKLSGGQKQRLSIACALVNDPDLVFLDEPTAALDPQARRNLWDVLARLNESGRTVVLTTHYMDEAEILCDRVAIVDRGKILSIDSPAALVRGLNLPVQISLAPGTLTPEQAAALPGVESAALEQSAVRVSTRRPALVLTALAERDALEGLSVRGATLEDVFLDLTGREYRA
ncbi:ABC transporter ATP-binding protein [Mumia zhuanghuii]|uniref:ABC transporter ATP-binding protein n=1 Tax=Mumia zhuanghuii TaxID=2585211 RepID=UPI00362FD1C3